MRTFFEQSTEPYSWDVELWMQCFYIGWFQIALNIIAINKMYFKNIAYINVVWDLYIRDRESNINLKYGN